MSNNRPVTSPGRKTRAYLWRQCDGATVARESWGYATKFRIRKEPNRPHACQPTCTEPIHALRTVSMTMDEQRMTRWPYISDGLSLGSITPS